MSRDPWGFVLLAGLASLVVVFVILFVNNMLYLVRVRRLFEYLKERHPQTYQSLGSPSIFVRNSPGSAWALVKFLFSRQPDDDLQLVRQTNQLRGMLIFCVVLMGVWVALFGVVALGFKLAPK